MDDPTDRIVSFLRDIGIPVRECEVGDGAFLPGVRVVGGGIEFERARLRWPGDLLHEAGHIAVTPPALRPQLPGLLDGHPAHAPGGEIEATAWAWAALAALGLPAGVLFHEGGYHGRSASLATTFDLGVYPGAAGLAAAGMTCLGEQARSSGIAPYPHMIHWLKPESTHRTETR